MDTKLGNETIALSAAQQKEVLRREKEFEENKVAARSWEDVKNDLEKIYG